MAVNKNGISLREGSIYIDGKKVAEAATLTINFQPEVSTHRVLGEKGMNRRWIGRDITGALTEWKSTKWLTEKIQQYEKTGATPELTIQGYRLDKNSDFYKNTKKAETVTLTGVVLTGDLPLMALDTAGELVQQTVSFGAKDCSIA